MIDFPCCACFYRLAVSARSERRRAGPPFLGCRFAAGPLPAASHAQPNGKTSQRKGSLPSSSQYKFKYFVFYFISLLSFPVAFPFVLTIHQKNVELRGAIGQSAVIILFQLRFPFHGLSSTTLTPCPPPFVDWAFRHVLLPCHSGMLTMRLRVAGRRVGRGGPRVRSFRSVDFSTALEALVEDCRFTRWRSQWIAGTGSGSGCRCS